MTPHSKQQQIHPLQVQHQGQSHGGSTVSPLIWSEPPGLLQEDSLETHLDHEKLYNKWTEMQSCPEPW